MNHSWISYLPYFSYLANAISIPLVIWNWVTKWNDHQKQKIRNVTIPVTFGEDAFQKEIKKIDGKTVNLNLCVDFSIIDEFASDLLEQTEITKILDDAKYLNNKRIPIYRRTNHGTFDSFNYLVLSVKDENELQFSHGGTGIVQLLLSGKFKIERRAYSGPSTEYTVRQIT